LRPFLDDALIKNELIIGQAKCPSSLPFQAKRLEDARG